MIVLGLDVSTKMGWAVLDQALWVDGGVFSTDPKNVTFDRWMQYEDHTEWLIKRYNVEFVIIEGYGYANHFSLATLVTVGTLVRRAVTVANLPWIEVAPNSLKKFVTGNGAAKKAQMMLELYKRFIWSTKDDNVADALGLAAMGQALVGWDFELPKTNMESVVALKKKYEKLTKHLPHY